MLNDESLRNVSPVFMTCVGSGMISFSISIGGEGGAVSKPEFP